MTRIFRYSITFLLLITCSLNLKAQSDSVFNKKIAQDFCDEFDKIKDKITKDNFEMELGLILMPILNRHETDIKKYWGYDKNQTENLEKIGRKVGELGAINCASFRTFIGEKIKALSNEEPETKTASGKLIKIEGQPFTYLLIQAPNGKTEKIWWMEYFEGADKLAVDTKLFLNRTVQVEYKETEVFDSVSKEYKTIKVVTALK